MKPTATLSTGCCFVVMLCSACTTTNPDNDPAAEQAANGWTVEHSYTKEIANYTFVFPPEGYAYEHRDSLVDACMDAIRRNLELLEVDSMSVPYRITFYPSKAAMKQATNIGVSGHADYWSKKLAFVATDDPKTIEMENIIPAPITHETMHMVAIETWGFPPENNLWLNEGLATFAANSCNGRTVREVHSYLLAHDMTFPMDSLVGRFYACDEMIAYHQAARIVQYLIEHHGIEKFGALWRAGSTELGAIHGMSFPELEAVLYAEVQEAYPQGVELDWEMFKKGCK